MLYPMFAMMLLTFTVGGYLFKIRIAAVKSGEIRLSAFCLNKNEDMPVEMLQAARNYTNLFEMPLLFYTAGAVSLALHLYSPGLILLGWLFVVFRSAHSWIHLTSNNVIRRMQAFMASNICVLLMWIILVWEYAIRGAY